MLKDAVRFKEHFGTKFKIDDWQAVDLVLAAVAAHSLPGEMLWLRIIGASGSGKTELLRALTQQEGYCETMESLTPGAIRRGYAQRGGTAVRLLERINGKLVITKELAPLLTTDKEKKLEVFGLLRSVHDGELDADYGSPEGHLQQKTNFDWLLAATTYVDRQSQLELQLGSRFIDLRWGTPLDRQAAIKQAMRNDPMLPFIRLEVARYMRALIQQIKRNKVFEMPVPTWLPELAHLVGILRTPVLRDIRKQITDLPSPELGTRIGQSFQRLAKGLAFLGIQDVQPYLVRLAWDCIPPLRAAVLREMLNGSSTQEDIGEVVGVSQVTVKVQQDDLIALRAFTRRREPLLDYDLLKAGRCEQPYIPQLLQLR